jgi:uncharacterized protein DUF4386
MERIGMGPPQPGARTIAVVYLLFFLTAFSAAFLTKGLVVPGDAAATASGMLAHEGRYRSGFAVELVSNALYIAVTALFYRLFGPVNRSLSLLAAFFSLVGCAIQIVGGLFLLAPFFVLGDSQLSSAFKVEQLQAAALLSLTLHAQVIKIALVLFAFYDFLLGYLIFRSTFLPRTLGVLLMCAGVGWLTFIWPPLAAALSSYVLPFGALAEILLMLWLLVKGVDLSRWRQKVETERTGGA